MRDEASQNQPIQWRLVHGAISGCCVSSILSSGGSLPRGGQSLAWEAQNYRFSSQSETSYQATLLPRCNGGDSRPGRIVTNGYCWGWVVQRYEVCFAGGSEVPRSNTRGVEKQEVSLVVLESRMVK